MNARIFALTLVSLACAAGALVIAADPPAKAKPQSAPAPAKRLVEYRVPKACIYYCADQAEATRRWNILKETSSADVFTLSGGSGVQSLVPIITLAPLRKIGGGTDSEPSIVAIDVTDEQDKAIKGALADKKLFVIYYHYGW